MSDDRVADNTVQVLWKCPIVTCHLEVEAPKGETPKCNGKYHHGREAPMVPMFEFTSKRTIWMLGTGAYEQWGPAIFFESEEKAKEFMAKAETLQWSGSMDDGYDISDYEVYE